MLLEELMAKGTKKIFKTFLKFFWSIFKDFYFLFPIQLNLTPKKIIFNSKIFIKNS